MNKRCVIVLLILIFASGFALAQDGEMANIEPLEECFGELAPEAAAIDIECGYLTVPEVHSEDNGNTVQIAFARLNSTSDYPGTPMFMLHGGPGGAATVNLADPTRSLIYQQYLGERDIVLFDQRGGGNSLPLLSCEPEVVDRVIEVRENNLIDEELRAAIDASFVACGERYIAEGVNLAAFNSIQNAADVNALVQALGYDEVILNGASYGTVLAQHVLREYPDIVSAVIFDGSQALGNITSWTEEGITNYNAVWGRYFELCAMSEICSSTFGDLATQYDQVMQIYAENPYVMSYGDVDVIVDDLFLAQHFYQVMHVPDFGARLPATIAGLSGNTPFSSLTLDEVMEGLIALEALYATPPSEGGTWMAHFAFTCAELPVTSLDQVIDPDDSLLASRQYGYNDAANYVAACATIDVPPIPDEARMPVPTDKPVLFLNGQLDNATTLEWNQVLMDVYEQEYAFEFPLQGHVQFYNLTTQACVSSIVMDFLSDPTTEPDGSCIDELPTNFDFIGM